jgi:hypothetical protein
MIPAARDGRLSQTQLPRPDQPLHHSPEIGIVFHSADLFQDPGGLRSANNMDGVNRRGADSGIGITARAADGLSQSVKASGPPHSDSAEAIAIRTSGVVLAANAWRISAVGVPAGNLGGAGAAAASRHRIFSQRC